MTVSRLSVFRSETRDLAERERGRLRLRFGEPTDWYMRSSSFLTGFVVIAAVLAVLALALRW